MHSIGFRKHIIKRVYLCVTVFADGLSYHNNMRFTTKDADYDVHSSINCAVTYKGAWWYKAGHRSNLNGLYEDGCTSNFATGMTWYSARGHFYSFAGTEMKIRPSDYR